MDIKAAFQDFTRMLTNQIALPINPISIDRAITSGVPIHRHDFHELRFIFHPGSGLPERVDVVYPCVCHNFLPENEINRSVTIDLISEQSRFIYLGIYCGVFTSTYIAATIAALNRLRERPGTPEIAAECRLLLTLMCLCADSPRDELLEDDKVGIFIRQLRDFYYRHDLSITELAERIGYSPNYIQRVFKNAVGVTPKAYLLRLRMEAARRFLGEKRYSVKEVASLCGFSCHHYFSNAFHQYYGYPPSRCPDDSPDLKR